MNTSPINAMKNTPAAATAMMVSVVVLSVGLDPREELELTEEEDDDDELGVECDVLFEARDIPSPEVTFLEEEAGWMFKLPLEPGGGGFGGGGGDRGGGGGMNSEEEDGPGGGRESPGKDIDEGGLSFSVDGGGGDIFEAGGEGGGGDGEEGGGGGGDLGGGGDGGGDESLGGAEPEGGRGRELDLAGVR